jgi:uncharacterized protein (TIGR03382 family)
MSDQTAPNSGGFFRIIDVSSVSRPFFWIKWANVFILSIAVTVPFTLLGSLLKGEVDINFLAFFLPYSLVLGFAGWIAWKNVTVLNAVIQPWSLTSLFLLGACAFGITALLSILLLFAAATQHSNEQEINERISGIMNYGATGLLAVAAAIAVIWLRRRRITALNLGLTDFIRAMKSPSGGTDRRSLPPKNGVLGWCLIAGGTAIMLGLQFVPDSIYFQSSDSLKTFSQISNWTFLLFLYARSQFQPTAETLLANDKRPPVLLLRSFADDETISYSRGNFSFVDQSFESRIAKHFFSTGPFIAVGRPKGHQPVIGAARATLADSEWQGKVIDWMDSAAVIIVMAGVTNWINWELKKVIERGHAHKLILCFPQSKRKRFAKDKRFRTLERVAIARLEGVKAALEGTAWEAQLSQLDNPVRIRSMVFEEDGRLTAVAARSRNRNAYHLAALIAHYLLLQNAARPGTESSGLKPSEERSQV